MTGIVLALGVLFAYPFLLYPLLLEVLARRAERRPAGRSAHLESPAVALVICALNEAKILRGKIENSMALDYPKGKLRVVVVSDGSTDNTAAIAREFRALGVELIENSSRQGKSASLNGVVPQLSEDVIVFSDANVLYERDALLRLTARFDDPSVGGVSGKVVLTNSAPSLHSPQQNYYSLEWRLQENASAIYSMAGADGAMYAIRRSLWARIPADTLLDDFVIPMNVVRQGGRMVFEPGALGWEEGPSRWQEEYRRKVRIAAGAAQVLGRAAHWPREAPVKFWFLFLSHKVLRWLSPLVGVFLLAFSLASWQEPLSRFVLFAAGALAVAGLVRLLINRPHPLLDTSFYFVLNETAVGLGLLKGVVGRQSVLWAKVDR
jgi:cellulose synthase/poly-beta-1,6-N-acetylglucosamine synthase-like glycosyltransferase